MNRPSQILIGLILLSLAFVFFLMSMLPDQGDYLVIRQFGALLAGLLGFACVFSWGRPYTTRVAFGILSLAMFGMALSILMFSKPDIKPAAFASLVAFMSGAYAITGYDPLFGKKNSQPETRVIGKAAHATEHKPHAANVPGDFYVEDGCCTMCLVPISEAPELFGECQDPMGYTHCFVKRQPETPGELKKMLSAIRCAELMCIRYRGTDRRIHLELVETETGVVCDNLPPDLQKRVDKQEAKSKGFLEAWQAACSATAQPRKPWWKFWG